MKNASYLSNNYHKLPFQYIHITLLLGNEVYSMLFNLGI